MSKIEKNSHARIASNHMENIFFRVSSTNSDKDSKCIFYFASGSGGEVLWWVCLCVCLSARISPEPHARSLLIFFCACCYGRGSVLLWQGDEIPRGRGSFRGFLPRWQCIVQHSNWDPYKKTVQPIEMPFGMMTLVGRRCVRWGPDLRMGLGNFWRKT